MMCEECGLRPARFHIVTLSSDAKAEKNLCPECMAKAQTQMPGLDMSEFAGFLSNMFSQHLQKLKKSEPIPDIMCNSCGMTYEQFHRDGLLGCVHCYDAFRTPLEALVQRKQGYQQHLGRRPGRISREAALRMDIERMHRQMAKAIEEEDYERAAQLRDEIRSNQSALGQIGHGQETAPSWPITHEGGAEA